jgi:hypothetical protein
MDGCHNAITREVFTLSFLSQFRMVARSFQMCFSLSHMQAPCQQRITLLKPAFLVIEAAWCMVGDRRKL